MGERPIRRLAEPAGQPATFSVHKRNGVISIVFWTGERGEIEFRFNAMDADRLICEVADALDDEPLLPDEPHA